MTPEKNIPLAKRYFISRSTSNAQDYEEFWIRYRPERVSIKKFGAMPYVLTALTLITMIALLVSLFNEGLWSNITFVFFALSILFYCISRRFIPNFFFKFLYPTHLQLNEAGLTFHWMRTFFKASSTTLDWDKVSYITSVDKKEFKKLSIDVNFSIDSKDIKLKDKLLFSLMSPAMSSGWMTSDNPSITTNIDGIASSEDRKKLNLAFKKFIPSYKVEPKVADDLNMYIKFDSYTDIWLETLSSSKERSLETALPKGQLLSNGSYKILEHIGAGGEALVYIAELLKPIPSTIGLDGTSRNETIVDMSDMPVNVTEFDMYKTIEAPPTVVLKEFILPSQAGVNARQRVLENIREEAVLWRKMRDKNIVRLLDFFAEDQRAYIVLEWVEGKSLKSIALESGNYMPESKVIELALVMCDILAYLHRKSPPVVHRDFTPDNLILDNSGALKLTDFNIALQLEAESTKTVAGKHSYIPPEQYKGQSNPQSDIYSFGCTLAFLATGKEPQALCQSEPKAINPDLSDTFNNIVKKCTSQEISQRYNSILEVKDQLQELNKLYK